MEPKLIEGSKPSFRSELDLSQVPMTDVGILNSSYQPCYTVANFKDQNNNLQFVIPSSNSHYYDFASSFLYLKLRILKQNGEKLGATDEVSGSHNMFASLFEGLEVSINSQVVSKSSNMYPYRVQILDLLTHGLGYKSSQLTSQLYYPDSVPNKFDSSNGGFLKRLEITK